jgi:two-component system, sensor histidine kinase and response regulator
MQSRNLLAIVAGQSSIFAVLTLILVVSIAGAPLLQQKKVVAQHIGADVAMMKAYALSEAILADFDGDRSLDRSSSAFVATHVRNALAPQAAPAPDAFTRRAVDALRLRPGRPHTQFVTLAGTPHLLYAVSDGANGVLTINLNLETERNTIGRYFGQAYLSAAATAYILIGLLLFAAFALRYYLRSIARMPEDERRAMIQENLRSAQRERRNLLGWLLILCACVFAADLVNLIDTAVGIGYVLAVMLSLYSNRHWHVTATASAGAILLLAAPILSPYDAGWWAYLENHSVSVFAILMTGFFGAANFRKSQAEAFAIAEAARSRTETAELRGALERAEAAETANRRMVERMRAANEAADISVWEWHIKRNVTTVDEGSPMIARLGGQKELQNGSDYGSRYVHEDDRERWMQAFTGALVGNAGDVFSLRYRTAQGSRWIQLHARVLRNSRGQPSRVLGIDWDVTREEQAKEAIARSAAELRAAQERFQRAVSGTQDALFEFNLQTDEIWHSPRFAAMLGYDADEATHGALESHIHPEDGALVGKAMGDHLRSGAPYDVEYRLRKKDGSWLWVRSRASAERDAEGHPLWLAGSIHDITEERAAREAMVRATQEAEAASRSKSTFLATMSHEIRTPMNGIIGMTGLLLETGLDRAQRDYAETIRASADSLLTILNDILDFSKIEAGKLDIEKLELELRANVDDVGSIMAFQAAAKGLELVVNVRPEVPERVLGDPQRIRQCLLNLVGNAIKFTHSGEVVLEVCMVGNQTGRALVHFEVRDTGIGVAPEALERLFQPFTQADSSTTRRFGGTGLGLSIVRRLVDLMGGQVGAQSEIGRGSTFWFTLPLEVVVSDDAPHAQAAAPAGRRVLLVDDNDTNRRVLSSQMEHAGYRVTSAPSARRALEILRTPNQGAFDVVVLDYQMPDMDGAMLGEQIMKARDIAPTRLMLLTSLDRSGDMQRFADIGFCAYLTKPVRTRELLDCLGRALAHDAQDWALHSQPIITRGTLIAREPARRKIGGCVLLVEDNAINQRVARRFLERLGCDVHVVGDGAQAIEAYQRTRYDFILMDMQMPVMDGLEATQRIRELEVGADRGRTPIVALTANAMMGTLERCLEAGMDDYLTKPLDITRLQDALERFIDGGAVATTTATPASGSGAAPLGAGGDLDKEIRERLADVAGDDAEFIGELVEAFIGAGRDAVLEIRAAAHRGDNDALARAAHKLKGASANLHVNVLAALTQDLEARAKANASLEWSVEVEKIATEFERIAAAFKAAYGEGAQRKAG